MMDFIILNSPESASYFQESNYKDQNDRYLHEHEHFEDYHKPYFLDAFKKYTLSNHQAGYSKSKKCNYLGVILVIEDTGDGAFNGLSTRSTYLIDNNNKITDINNNCNIDDEVGCRIATLYHPLPDGKVIELPLKKNYEENLDDIYEEILKFRRAYTLSNQLPEKPEVSRKMKI